jgi:hypothetical protein
MTVIDDCGTRFESRQGTYYSDWIFCHFSMSFVANALVLPLIGYTRPFYALLPVSHYHFMLSNLQFHDLSM